MKISFVVNPHCHHHQHIMLLDFFFIQNSVVLFKYGKIKLESCQDYSRQVTPLGHPMCFISIHQDVENKRNFTSNAFVNHEMFPFLFHAIHYVHAIVASLVLRHLCMPNRNAHISFQQPVLFTNKNVYYSIVVNLMQTKGVYIYICRSEMFCELLNLPLTRNLEIKTYSIFFKIFFSFFFLSTGKFIIVIVH